MSNEEAVEFIEASLEPFIEGGRLDFSLARARRDYVRLKLQLIDRPQLSGAEAEYLLENALNDPEIWEDAIQCFGYHVGDEDKDPPKALMLFAAYALVEKPPKLPGRSKERYGSRNLLIQMMAARLVDSGLEKGIANSLIANVLSKLGHSVETDAIRKVVDNYQPTDIELKILSEVWYGSMGYSPGK